MTTASNVNPINKKRKFNMVQKEEDKDNRNVRRFVEVPVKTEITPEDIGPSEYDEIDEGEGEDIIMEDSDFVKRKERYKDTEMSQVDQVENKKSQPEGIENPFHTLPPNIFDKMEKVELRPAEGKVKSKKDEDKGTITKESGNVQSKESKEGREEKKADNKKSENKQADNKKSENQVTSGFTNWGAEDFKIFFNKD
jgi:hypothetical protein